MIRISTTFRLLAVTSIFLAAACDSPNDPVTLQVTQPVTLEALGDSKQLEATIRGSDRLPEWSSSNPAVASVTRAGMVTAVSPGTVTVTARAAGAEATGTVTVLPLAAVEAYELKLQNTPNGGRNLRVMLRNAGGRGFYTVSVFRLVPTAGGEPRQVRETYVDLRAEAGMEVASDHTIGNDEMVDFVAVWTREPQSAQYRRTSCVRMDGQPGCPLD